ncbi:centrin-1 [Pycnococcus provasolii]
MRFFAFAFETSGARYFRLGWFCSTSPASGGGGEVSPSLSLSREVSREEVSPGGGGASGGGGGLGGLWGALGADGFKSVVDTVIKKKRDAKQDAASVDVASSIAAWLRKRGKAVRPVLSKEQRDELRECFNLIDADGSGAIDADELIEAFKVLGYHIKRKECEALLAEVDRDGSGEVEYPEFVEIMTTKLSKRNDEDDDDVSDAVKADAARAKKKALPFQLLATAYRRKRMLEAVIHDENGMRAKLALKAEENEEEEEEEKQKAAAAEEKGTKSTTTKNSAGRKSSSAGISPAPVRSRANVVPPVDASDKLKAEKKFGFAGITPGEPEAMLTKLPSIDRRESDSEAAAARNRQVMPPSHTYTGSFNDFVPTVNFETGDIIAAQVPRGRAQRIQQTLPMGLGKAAASAVMAVEDRARRRHVNAKVRQVRDQGGYIHSSFEEGEDMEGESAAAYNGVHPRQVASHLAIAQLPHLNSQTPQRPLREEASAPALFRTPADIIPPVHSPSRASMNSVLPHKRYKYVNRPDFASPAPRRAASSLGLPGEPRVSRGSTTGARSRKERRSRMDEPMDAPAKSSVKLHLSAQTQVRELSLDNAIRSQSSLDGQIGSSFPFHSMHALSGDVYSDAPRRRVAPSPLFF